MHLATVFLYCSSSTWRNLCGLLYGSRAEDDEKTPDADSTPEGTARFTKSDQTSMNAQNLQYRLQSRTTCVGPAPGMHPQRKWAIHGSIFLSFICMVPAAAGK
jgi:hypothetical protein